MSESVSAVNNGSGNTQTEKIPLLTDIIIFRAIAAVVMGCVFYYWTAVVNPDSLLSFSSPVAMGLNDWRLGSKLVVAVAGTVSAAVVIGLLLRKMWAVVLLMLFNLVAIAWLAYKLPLYARWEMQDRLATTAIYLFVFFIESLVVVLGVISRAMVRRLYLATAILTLIASCSVPIVQRYMLFHRLQPLLSYVDSHFIDIPEDVYSYDILISKDRDTGYSIIDLDRPPGSYKDNNEKYHSLRLRAKELGGGRWHIQAGDNSKFPMPIMLIYFSDHMMETPEKVRAFVVRSVKSTHAKGVGVEELESVRNVLISEYDVLLLLGGPYRVIYSRETEVTYMVSDMKARSNSIPVLFVNPDKSINIPAR